MRPTEVGRDGVNARSTVLPRQMLRPLHLSGALSTFARRSSHSL